MGIREFMERHKYISAGAIAGIILAAIVFTWRNTVAPANTSDSSEKAFFTIDDGKSYFAESAKRIPPFEWQGKTAHRAAVFTCDGGKTRFVGYIERYTPEAKKTLEIAQSGQGVLIPGSAAIESEVKKPGDQTWVRRNSAAAITKVMRVPCPPGGELEEVTP
jgi:hypothetical protein